MEKYNILTGFDFSECEEVSPLATKMCINCIDCLRENDGYFCKNSKVMETGRKKILDAVPEGFEIETLTLKPMALKNPTKKCPNYCVNEELVVNSIMELLR